MRLGTHKIHTRRGKILKWRGRLAVGGVILLLAVAAPFLLSLSQAQAACECNIFGTPTGQSNFDDGSDVELGVKFIPSVNGTISGVRFYKQGSMGGTHVGRLWQLDGTPMANATFTETASGWQSVTFSSPVSVTAGTTYVASVTMNDGRYIATPNYFTTNIVNGPLTAPSGASSGGNGIFNVNAGSFPSTASGNNSNYWIDVAFFATDPPSVTGVTPTNGTTNVEPGDTVTATFDQSMNASSFTDSTFTIKDANQNAVAGTYTYDNTNKKVSFVATEGFSTNTTYTATLEGGGVKNAADIALASDYVWTFTTAAANACPCSLKDRVNPTSTGSFDDTGTTELGVKVRPSTNGYISSLRFYKPIISSETTHTGNIWNSSGTKLATVTFTNESEYGWQEARLSTPLRVYEDQLYILSYGTTTSTYVASQGALTGTTLGGGYLKAYADQASENNATGSGTRNGVFTTTAGNYPGSGSTNGSYYWIDAVFSVASNPNLPLEVGVTQPKADAVGISRTQAITAKFNRPIDTATVTNSTFRLFDSTGAQVSGTGTFDVDKGVAKFTPSTQLTSGQRYTAKLSGTVADTGGVSLGSEYSWSFVVGSPITTDPHAVPGGPILAITNSGSPTSKYYTEILRTEGLNYYDAKDLGDVNATVLASYKVVVLAEMSLTQPQADMLSDWVNAGGNLIAMRPDSKLAGLLGLSTAGTTRANQYMLINTSSGPGQGLVAESIQYKGTADNYSLNGATSLATFYSDATTATSNPAVTTRSVGSNGGTAVAFAYDLAKSVIMLHQGNQPWAGQDRDNVGPIRANDLFYGNKTGDVQPDWVDLNKIHIPQADEQQRLLANIIIESTKDKQPMPRFWYLPGSTKAALVMAGDDHGLGDGSGTQAIMTNWLNDSATNCSLLDWECVRASHYIYTSSGLTNTRAAQFLTHGFEIGDHISTTCSNFGSLASLTAEYTADLNTWRAKYTSVPNQVSHRYHCYVWSDWDSQARVDVLNGIRYDLNYVAFPAAWIGARSPIMTGSGMNMRFTDTTGAMLDVRQGVTNFDDQASTATNINALLDNAIGASGYYGIYGTHYDMSNPFDKTLFASAAARNVPMISSQQALTWLDGRNSSTFSNFTGSNGQFSFDITTAVGAIGLRAMLPTHDAGGTLSALTIGGTAVSYQTQTVKGQEYAVFSAVPGTYTATYSDYTPPSGGGGNSGGSSGGASGNSQTGQGAGTSTRSAVAANTPSADGLLTEEVPSETEPVQTTEPQTNTQTPITDSPNVMSDTSGDESQGFGLVGWALGALGIGFIGLVGWWLLVWRRRHNADVGGPQF